jgi:hypothetical protein
LLLTPQSVDDVDDVGSAGAGGVERTCGCKRNTFKLFLLRVDKELDDGLFSDFVGYAIGMDDDKKIEIYLNSF